MNLVATVQHICKKYLKLKFLSRSIMSSPPDPPPSRTTATGHGKRTSSTPNALYGLHQHGYILGRTLGTGAYAKVKKAIDLNSHGRRVAIKIVNKKKAPRDVVHKFLPREVKALRMIVHDNVIKCYDVIDTDDALYIVMEIADGGDVLDYINKRTRLTESVARLLFHDLLSGVEHCHTMSIVHRDLKCENLLLSNRMILKISDFGFARELDGKNLETYCGSYAYAAPEVILGQPYVGEPADIWSMGVILYAMVVGRLPFKDNDVKTLLSEISHHITLPSYLTDDIKDLIVRMLTYNPQERVTIAQIKCHTWLTNIAESLRIRSKIFSDKIPSSPAPHAQQTEARKEVAEKGKKPANSAPQPTSGATEKKLMVSSSPAGEGSGVESQQEKKGWSNPQATTVIVVAPANKKD
jgi:serine kinase